MITYSKVEEKGFFDTYTISSLKNLAFLIMLIDHIGVILYPEISTFRVIGRIAFPMFAFLTIYNFTFNVKDRTKQLITISILALISQIAFIVAFDYGTTILNIFYSMLLVCAFIHIYEDYKSKILIYLSYTFLFALSFFVEYGFFGFSFMIFLYSFLRIESSKFNLLMIFISVSLVNGFVSIVYSVVAVLTIAILIMIYLDSKSINLFSYRFDKYFYYGFYPFHLLILSIFSNIEEFNKFVSFLLI